MTEYIGWTYFERICSIEGLADWTDRVPSNYLFRPRNS